MECRECGKACDDIEFLARHLKAHKIKFKDYTLKWEHNDVRPLCACGCGTETAWNVSMRSFTTYAHGHHALGHVKSDETKAKIGAKNSVHKKKWCTENPEAARQKAQHACQSSQTPEARAKRSISINKFWMTPESEPLRRIASIRACSLLDAGLIGPQAPYKSSYIFNPYTNQDEYMHSSWEATFMLAAIEVGYEVTKSHDIRIDYIAEDNKQHTYIPDFVSYANKHLIEIKGFESERDRYKKVAAETWCANNGYEFVYLHGAVK